ncbi:hypothetical protein CC78DRAFT_615368 [Lojkania enalia]|uniref:glucan endo-1,3-beta-D-glucosidase n=1 Tax=Lojkania enalia TaxID=147567 RepID=A0A9P4KD93_9PLEO|nr:hypothetical protein CC78DRAFT_615368 [Didymosphaeria enalia]
MRFLVYSISLLPWLAHSKTAGDLCRGTAHKADDGNWYCSEVQKITYHNISQSGMYNRTTGVDAKTGLCAHEPIRYNGRGSLTPLLGEVSMHLRGPMSVSKIAVYDHPGDMFGPQHVDATAQTDGGIIKEPSIEHNEVNRALNLGGDIPTTATQSMNGNIIKRLKYGFQTLTRRVPKPDQGSTLVDSTHFQQPMTSSAHPEPIPPKPSSSIFTRKPVYPHPPRIAQPKATDPPASPDHASRTTEKVSKRAAGWDRVAYYTSTAPAEATGIVFLANLGDDRVSGTFDYAFGNSLGYVGPEGKKVVSNPMPFDGYLKTSEYEIAGFTDKGCGDNECEGRPKSTQYHGWDGEAKAFFIEFQMDHLDNDGDDQGMIADAPAWWFLNAAIPRTLQYGNDRHNIPCSCWSTGCGEFDAFEVLGKGEERAKSTIHRQGNLQGGDSNYFKRPVGRMLKFGVVFWKFDITAAVLDDDFDFSESMGQDAIDRIVAYDAESNQHSLFKIGD